MNFNEKVKRLEEITEKLEKGDFELESIEFHAAPPHKVLRVN